VVANKHSIKLGPDMATSYILASSRNRTLYHGSTTDLSKRIWEHKEKLTPGLTSRWKSFRQRRARQRRANPARQAGRYAEQLDDLRQ
jgi:hypothetical protein